MEYVIEMGNHDAKHGVGRDDKTDEVLFEKIDGQRVFRMVTPEGWTLGETFTSITQPVRGAWANHSDSPPAWVETNSAGLTALLAEHFGCEAGAPKDLEEKYHTLNGPPGYGPKGKIKKGGSE